MGQARRQRESDRAATGTVAIAYLHPGQVSAYFLESLLATMLYDVGTSRRVATVLQEWSSANVSAARNTLVQRFLDHDSRAEWLLFIDSDMQWDHDAVDRILTAADPQERPVVGGLCFGAAHGVLYPTIYTLHRVGEQLTTMRVGSYPRDRLVSCDATGAAFLLIHRSVLVEMRERGFNAAFPWFQETEGAGRPVGEDITFCLRVRAMGLPVHVDTRIRVGHHKSVVYSEAMFDAQREE